MSVLSSSLVLLRARRHQLVFAAPSVAARSCASLATPDVVVRGLGVADSASSMVFVTGAAGCSCPAMGAEGASGRGVSLVFLFQKAIAVQLLLLPRRAGVTNETGGSGRDYRRGIGGRLRWFRRSVPLNASGTALDSGTYKGAEQRVAFGWFAFELRVELHCQKEWVRREFEDFDQTSVWAEAGELHPMRLELASVDVVEFVTVAMPLRDGRLLVCPVGDRIGLERTRLCTEAHRAAHIRDLLLFVQ